MFAVGVRTAFIESPGFLRRTRRSVREETLPGELFRFFTPRFGPPGSLSIASRFFDNIRTRCRVPSSQLRATPASRPPGNSRKVISTGSGVTRFETTRWNAICDEELFDVAMKISIGSLRGFFRRGAARFCLATFFEGSLLSRICRSRLCFVAGVSDPSIESNKGEKKVMHLPGRAERKNPNTVLGKFILSRECY